MSSDAIQVARRTDLLPGRAVWVIELANDFDSQRTLLLSKVSEAVRPNTVGNHVGEGATMDEFLQAQPGVRFVINGGFNHYRKQFYAWPHQDFNVGDPVGLVKIRDHYFEDLLDTDSYGFLVQLSKLQPWSIVGWEQVDKSAKYILGCTPMLVHGGLPIVLSSSAMTPVPVGNINPPSVLGHGLQRHPRTAVGLTNTSLWFIVVEGGEGEGCTLPELQSVGLQLGLDSLLNLDGGGSAQFRLRTPDGWICNYVAPEDAGRILGNVIVLFEEALKAGDSLQRGYSGPSADRTVRDCFGMPPGEAFSMTTGCN